MKRILLILLFFVGKTLFSQVSVNESVYNTFSSRNFVKYNRFLSVPTFSVLHKERPTIAALVRKTNIEFEGAPQLYMLSGVMQMGEDQNIGVGVSVFQQEIGVFKDFGFVANFADKIQTGRDNTLSFGVNLVYSRRGIQETNVISDKIDPLVENYQAVSMFVLQPGVSMSFGNIDTGLYLENAVDYNLKKSEMATGFGDKVIAGHIGYNMIFENSGLFEKSNFGVVGIVKKKPGGFGFGANVIYNTPKLGWLKAGYDNTYGFQAGAGINVFQQLGIGFTFAKTDLGITNEIGVIYSFGRLVKKPRKPRPRKPRPNKPNKPVTAKPVTNKPVTAKPVTNKPVTAKPVTAKPVTNKPVTAKPVTNKPVTNKPVTAKPVTNKPVTAKPVTNKPVTAKPVTNKPVTAKPVTNKPVTAKPVTAKPVEEKDTSLPRSTKTPWREKEVVVKEKVENNGKGGTFYYVAVNQFRDKARMDIKIKKYKKKGVKTKFVQNPKNKMYYIYIDKYTSLKKADKKRKEINGEGAKGFENNKANVDGIKIRSVSKLPVFVEKITFGSSSVQGSYRKPKTQKPAKIYPVSYKGVPSGYYIRVSVNGSKALADKFIDELRADNIDANYFLEEERKLRHVYIYKTNSKSDAINMYNNNLNGTYYNQKRIIQVK